MNEFDKFVKHELHIQNYTRYTDDFAIASSDRVYLESLIMPISEFLNKHFALELHPNKISIRKLNQGIDFLGYLIFPKYRLIRTKTRKRIFTKFSRKLIDYKLGKISAKTLFASLNSYLGVLSHANTVEISERLKNLFWFK
jgi:hypothetical protein